MAKLDNARLVRSLFEFLPVHPDAVEDYGEADVKDEVDNANNQGDNC